MGKQKSFMHSGVWLCVLIKRCALTERSRTMCLMFCQLELFWEMQERCTIHHLGAFIKEKIHSRQRGSNREIQKYSKGVCVCVCVYFCAHVSSVSTIFERSTGSWSLGSFDMARDWVVDRLMGLSLALSCGGCEGHTCANQCPYESPTITKSNDDWLIFFGMWIRDNLLGVFAFSSAT